MPDDNIFTKDPGVVKAVAAATDAAGDKRFSDVVDEGGHEYVDLVMEGGGVLGIALLGYTYALERCGIRFFGIGGTSAGSITALLLAAWDQHHRAKSAALASELAAFDLSKVVDGDRDVQDFIESWLEGAGWFKLGLKGLQVLDTLLARKGLNPGNEFLAWISGILDQRGIKTTKQLVDRVQTMAPTITSVGQEITGPPKLKVVAAEVRTETRVDFPLMAPLFWKEWESLNPSYFVRASMSVPLFFEPLTIDDLPDTAELRECWKKLMWSGPIPSSAVFVDGGIMSNFPIDLFHAAERVPSRPTFGAKLGIDRTEPNRIAGPHHVVSAAFNAARHTLDTDFILRNPDYIHLLTYIDTGNHGWLNFSLTDEEQVDLFRRGAQAAADFVASFDWEEYKKLRSDVASAFKRSKLMEPLAVKWHQRQERNVATREGDTD